jgi:hypothetical protein
MPPVLQRHYANRPYTDDVVTLEGVMDVALSPLTRLMKPLFKILGALVPYEDTGIPTTVYSKSEPDSPRFILERHFRFANREPYIFRSVFVMLGGSDVVELMKFGISWRCDYVFDGAKVCLLHRGYVWRIGGILLPLPLTWVLGKGYAEEEALDDKCACEESCSRYCPVARSNSLHSPCFACRVSGRTRRLPYSNFY